MRVLKTFARLYTSDLDGTLEMFRAMGLEATADRRFALADNGIEVCIVGDTVVVAGDEDSLQPYRATDATWLVDDLDDALATLGSRVDTIVRPPTEVPTGRNATVRMSGAQIELVEWKSDR